MFCCCRQEEEPPAPRPTVINRYADQLLRDIVLRMKERTDIYKDKVKDPFASSPEMSPPASKYDL